LPGILSPISHWEKVPRCRGWVEIFSRKATLQQCHQINHNNTPEPGEEVKVPTTQTHPARTMSGPHLEYLPKLLRY